LFPPFFANDPRTCDARAQVGFARHGTKRLELAVVDLRRLCLDANPRRAVFGSREIAHGRRRKARHLVGTGL